MKKLIKTMSLSILGILLVLLTACSVTSINKIEFLDVPEPVYTLNADQNLNKVAATIEITYSDGKKQKATLDEAPSLGIKVSGATFSQVGDYTLTVSYGTIKASFEYKVIDSNAQFGGGYGTYSMPYIINNQTHLANIVNSPDSYFRLGTSFEVSNWTPISNFSGVLDGAGATITLKEEGDCGDSFALFAQIKGESNVKRAVVKNLTIISEIFYTGSLEVSALASSSENAKIEDVTINGTITIGNIASNARVSGFVSVVKSNTSFINCNNNASITNNSDGTSPIIGGIAYMVLANSNNIVFDNVKNSGNITDVKRNNSNTTAGQMIGKVEFGTYDNLTEVTINSNCQGLGIITGNSTINGEGKNEANFYGKVYTDDGTTSEQKNGKTTDSSKYIGIIDNYYYVKVFDPSNEYQIGMQTQFSDFYQKLENWYQENGKLKFVKVSYYNIYTPSNKRLEFYYLSYDFPNNIFIVLDSNKNVCALTSNYRIYSVILEYFELMYGGAKGMGLKSEDQYQFINDQYAVYKPIKSPVKDALTIVNYSVLVLQFIQNSEKVNHYFAFRINVNTAYDHGYGSNIIYVE